MFFFFNDTATTEIYTLSLHDALPIYLAPEEINRIKEFIEKNYKIEGELRQVIKQNIGRLKEIQCYRGIRHLKRLPARGQRTKTNSRTVRGNVRRTVSSGKRKTELK